MSLHIQRVDGEYRVVMTPAEFEALRIPDGAAVTVVVAEESVLSSGAAQPGSGLRYATREQVREVQRRTLPRHSKAYAELAK